MTDRIAEVTELRAGTDTFRSTGYSYVKVTRGGVVRVLKLPIQSDGVMDVIEMVRASEPRPPSKKVHVTHESPEGRALKLRPGERRWVDVFDFTDEGYVREQERYQERMALAVVNRGLAVPIKDESGAVVDDIDRKIAVLRGLGLSMNQFQQIVDDIQALTSLNEKDREDFFGDNSALGDSQRR